MQLRLVGTARSIHHQQGLPQMWRTAEGAG